MPSKKSLSLSAKPPTAKQFLETLKGLKKKSPSDNARFFRGEDPDNKILGVRMSAIFDLAKASKTMSLPEIEKLLESEYYEARMGAVSIMDFQAREKSITPEQRKQLFDLYVRRHDRINNWDLVDRSAPSVVGSYLLDKDRKPLYKLAKSKNVWERRTAIVSTYAFIKKNEIEDTFKIGDLLINDNHDLIQKAVGSWVREAGKRDKNMLLAFLDKHADTMPRITLRYAIEKLGKTEKQHYISLASM